MSQFHLKIVTPEEIVFDDAVSMLSAVTPKGEIGVLPNHVNFMTQITPGELRIKKDNKSIVMATGSGLLQMTNNELVILTDLAQKAESIDEKAAEEARKRAEAALEQTLSEEEYAATVAILERSLAQLKVKRRHRSVV